MPNFFEKIRINYKQTCKHKQKKKMESSAESEYVKGYIYASLKLSFVFKFKLHSRLLWNIRQKINVSVPNSGIHHREMKTSLHKAPKKLLIPTER